MLSPTTELLETGIKVIDLCPFAKGGNVGLFGGAGVSKTVNMMELVVGFTAQRAKDTSGVPCEPGVARGTQGTQSGSRYEKV